MATRNTTVTARAHVAGVISLCAFGVFFGLITFVGMGG
ncbi:hypothetical protein [Salmonella phage PKM.Hi.22.6]|uniref:Uncharacterized protein n=1 Tax=phage PKM.Lu.22.1 TaxID=3049197 RepID=A0AAF0R9F1_9CAUD|nr:hypothetical protein [phage PKM.Lu.22.1]WKV17044.1 hypothetical protein [Salmonella phage PKM.Hi.22.6]